MTAPIQLDADVRTKTSVVVVPGGKQSNDLLIERLRRAGLLVEPMRVRTRG